MENKHLILASKSPRRKELLSLCNIPFSVVESNVDETINKTNCLNEEIAKLAYNKAYEVFKSHKDCVVLGADTIVVIDDMILGKPKDSEDAKKMLKTLSNKKHKVITGTAFISENEVIKNCSVSYVYFNELTDDEIQGYIDSKEPLDKAGSYAIQGLGGCFINRIDGDYYSIMGLPLNYVYKIILSLKNKYKFL